MIAGRSRSRAGERGAGTVLVLAVAAVVVTLLLGALALLSVVLAGHRAAAAADLAALAAATALDGERDPGRACAAAERLAAANGARVTSCIVRGAEVWLATAVDPDWRGLPQAAARSRAGPPPDAPPDSTGPSR